MIPITKPLIGRPEADAAADVVMSGWLTQGERVAEFESVFAGIVGTNYACAVANCTVALHLALLAVGVGPGDEVVTVSHTFIACANAIRQCGAVPIFVDIDPLTFNMDPKQLEEAISSRTRAILCVHQMGMPCDLRQIVPIARAHGVPLIEDAACALGSEILISETWQPIGIPHGDIACFSLHPRKVITVGDGGMLTTRNPEWDERFRLWRQHGMSVPDTVRHRSNHVIFENYPTWGSTTASRTFKRPLDSSSSPGSRTSSRGDASWLRPIGKCWRPKPRMCERLTSRFGLAPIGRATATPP